MNDEGINERKFRLRKWGCPSRSSQKKTGHKMGVTRRKRYFAPRSRPSNTKGKSRARRHTFFYKWPEPHSDSADFQLSSGRVIVFVMSTLIICPRQQVQVQRRIINDNRLTVQNIFGHYPSRLVSRRQNTSDFFNVLYGSRYIKTKLKAVGQVQEAGICDACLHSSCLSIFQASARVIHIDKANFVVALGTEKRDRTITD